MTLSSSDGNRLVFIQTSLLPDHLSHNPSWGPFVDVPSRLCFHTCIYRIFGGNNHPSCRSNCQLKRCYVDGAGFNPLIVRPLHSSIGGLQLKISEQTFNPVLPSSVPSCYHNLQIMTQYFKTFQLLIHPNLQ